MTLSVDKDLYMVGNEDGGVSLMCLKCEDREMLPLAYYTMNPTDISYREYLDMVVRVTKIEDFVTAGKAHILTIHYPGEDN